MSIDKLYDVYVNTPPDRKYTDSGDLADLGVPPINDSFLKTKLEAVATKLLSLEDVKGFSVENNLLQCFFWMDSIMQYYAGLFEFSDPQFNRIKQVFIKQWYLGSFYMAYGQGYVNEELRVLRKGKTIQTTAIEEPDLYPNCKYRMYRIKRDYVTDEKTNTQKERVTFTSVLTGIEGHKFDVSKMVKVSFGGMATFIQWLELAHERVAMFKLYVQLSKLSATKYKATVSRPDSLASELGDIHGWSLGFQQEDDAMANEIEPFPFCAITDPKEFLQSCMLYLSQRMNALGVVCSPTEKAERMTTGEHYKDLRLPSNIEAQMLSNLTGVCADLNANFECNLEVALTSSLQANGAPKTTKDPFQKFKQNYSGFPQEGNDVGKQF